MIKKEHLKLLIITQESKEIHLKKFAECLQKYDIEWKIVLESKYIKKFFRFNIFPNKNKEFEKMLHTFTPDIVLLDKIGELGIKVSKAKIPLFVTIRGHIWNEQKWAMEKNDSIKFKIAVKHKEKILEQCLKNADVLLPISNYLVDIIKQKFPSKKIFPFPISSRDPHDWKNMQEKKLKHPCVGFCQGANIWGKTREMLLLPKILEKLPNVHFYWAGDGQYAKEILNRLEKFQNFHWLGSLSYPEQVRQYISELDIFALISGFDTFGQVILEASLLEKPIIATKIGGISEIVLDNQTGFLIEPGDYNGWIEKISLLEKNSKKCVELGNMGREFVENNFSWEKAAEKFIDILKKTGKRP